MNWQALPGFLVFSLIVIGAVSTIVFAIRAIPLRQRVLCIMASVLFCISVVGIWIVQDHMLQVRTEAELIDTVPLSEAPPLVAFTTIALGGFRGIIADILFLRSEAMKEREQYFEMVQLASWIVKLQPRFTGAIAFLGWNMAYNVSVTFTDHEDRWRWVQRGIELMRDEGLRYNPNDPVLYQELGWIYQHKLGNILDDAHNYYKVQLAQQIQTLTNQTYPIDWAKFASAPQEISVLDRQSKPIGGLQAQLGPTRWSALQKVLDSYDLTLLMLEDGFRDEGAYPEGMAEGLRKAAVFDEVDTFLRARWMRAAYQLDPAYIAGLIQKYGELDFRLPEAHAIYWASKGLDHAPGNTNLKCERMIFQSLKNAFQSGKLLYVSRQGFPFIGPNASVANAVRQAYLDAAANNENNRSIMSGYENFLKDAIVTLFVSGDERKAQEFLGYLRADFGHPAYRRPLRTFALEELGKDISGRSMKQVESYIADLLVRKYQDLAMDNLDAAATHQWLAEQIRQRFMADRDEGRSKDRVFIVEVNDPGLNRAIIRAVAESLPRRYVNNLQANLGLSDDAFAQIMRQPEVRESPPTP